MITQSFQIDRAKQAIARAYDLASEGYDRPPLRFFQQSAARLVEAMQIMPGHTVLDVGTGTGLTAIAAARRCEPGGRVVGIDIAQDMLKIASSKAVTAGLTNLDLQAGDGENLNFKDESFDFVLSTAALFFLPDMLAGLLEWLRVCKPGGTVAVSGFGRTAFQPLSDLFEVLIRSYGVDLPVLRRPFSWQRLDEPEAFRSLMAQAGCQDIQVQTEQFGYYLNGVDEWWQIIWNSGFRGPVSRLATGQLPGFKAQHLAQVARLAGQGGIWLDVPVIFATGRKPG